MEYMIRIMHRFGSNHEVFYFLKASSRNMIQIMRMLGLNHMQDCENGIPFLETWLGSWVGLIRIMRKKIMFEISSRNVIQIMVESDSNHMSRATEQKSEFSIILLRIGFVLDLIQS